jgi:amino acid transporter
MCLAFLVILTIGNLRGIRESGRIFAVPTYFFIVSILILIGIGGWRYLSGTTAPISGEPSVPANQLGNLTLLTLLTAYRWGRVPVLVTVIAVVTLSPGAIPAMVMALVAGDAVTSTLPEVNVLPVTSRTSVKYALVATPVRPAPATARTVTAPTS